MLGAWVIRAQETTSKKKDHQTLQRGSFVCCRTYGEAKKIKYSFWSSLGLQFQAINDYGNKLPSIWDFAKINVKWDVIGYDAQFNAQGYSGRTA